MTEPFGAKEELLLMNFPLTWNLRPCPLHGTNSRVPSRGGGGEGRGFVLSLVQKVGGSGFKMIEVKVRFGSEY